MFALSQDGGGRREKPSQPDRMSGENEQAMLSQTPSREFNLMLSAYFCYILSLQYEKKHVHRRSIANWSE